MNSITKTGQMKNNLFEEYRVEPDGSIWELVFVHNRPADQHFNSTDPFATGFSTNMNLFFNFTPCNDLTSWELLVVQADLYAATPQKRRWVQNKNPLTATFAEVAAANITQNSSTGYTTDSWGGLYPINNGNTYLCANNGTNGNWWGATGSKVFYSGGIPAWFGKIVKDGYVLIYVRVDSQSKNHAKVYKSNIDLGGNIYEY